MVQHFKETTVIWDCEMHNLINRSLALVTVLWNFPFRWRDSDDVYSQKGSCENISWGTVLRNKIFHRDIASASDCPMELRISQAGTTVFALKSLATFIPLKNIFGGWWMMLYTRLLWWALLALSCWPALRFQPWPRQSATVDPQLRGHHPVLLTMPAMLGQLLAPLVLILG